MVDPAHLFDFKLVDSSTDQDQHFGLPGDIRFSPVLDSATKTSTPPTLEPDFNQKRMAISARRTQGLRVSGFQEILARTNLPTTNPSKMQDPSVYGREEHYDRIKCWGAENGRHDGGLGISVPRLTSLSPVMESGTDDGPVGTTASNFYSTIARYS